LSDDQSFEIFRKHPVKFPVVFTTAYDKYIIESFEFNSVDYLLKPITEEKLRRSLNKVKKFQEHFLQGNLLKIINHLSASSKDRILVKKGTEFIALNINDIAYFFTEHKIVFVREFNGRQLIVDKTISELESIVDPTKFFRLNRKYLSSIHAIEKFKPENGKIKVILKANCTEDVYVSKETAPAFRRWIN
jgi:DNA-binding LytR/AlgR family response regulator